MQRRNAWSLQWRNHLVRINQILYRPCCRTDYLLLMMKTANGVQTARCIEGRCEEMPSVTQGLDAYEPAVIKPAPNITQMSSLGANSLRRSGHLLNEPSSQDTPKPMCIPQQRWQYVAGYTTTVRRSAQMRGSQTNCAPSWAPQLAPAWTNASIKCTSGSAVGRTRLQYPLPPPHMFFNTQNEGMLGLKVHNWIRIRTWCLSQVCAFSPCQVRQLTCFRYLVSQKTGKYA